MPRQTRRNLAGNCKFGTRGLTSKTVLLPSANLPFAELIAAMQLAHKPIYTIRNGSNKQAMAWVNDMGGGNVNLRPVIMKNGGTSGFRNVIAINPTKDAAIFIRMNQVGPDPAEKGAEILRRPA